MSDTHYHREGSTDYIIIDLLDDNEAYDISAVDHVELILKPSTGAAVTFTSAAGSPKLFITDGANGELELRPAATDFDAEQGPYKGYVKVYITSTRWASFPNHDEIIIDVRPNLS